MSCRRESISQLFSCIAAAVHVSLFVLSRAIHLRCDRDHSRGQYWFLVRELVRLGSLGDKIPIFIAEFFQGSIETEVVGADTFILFSTKCERQQQVQSIF